MILQSMQYMTIQKPHPLISTIFVRTLMDRRYFHGIRTAAAYALVKHAREENDWLGLYHLERAFQELFCLPGTQITRDNDFSDRASYILQKVIPEAISRIRDNNGKTPLRAKRFIFDKLRFSDNSNNEVYLALFHQLASSMILTTDHYIVLGQLLYRLSHEFISQGFRRSLSGCTISE